MSLYAEYVRERTNDGVIEIEEGFITFRWLHNTKQVYIVDIFVRPDKRNKGFASVLADKVAEMAKVIGYTEVLGTVVPSTNHSTESLRVLLSYGMTLLSASNDLIVFKKDI